MIVWYIYTISMAQISGIYTVGMFKNVLNSWNIPIRILSYLLYFIEPIYNVSQIKTVYALQFVTSLSNCHKLCIRLLIDLSKHDLRTVLFKNLESIAQDWNVQSRNLNKFCVKQNMIYNQIPLDQDWKLLILHDLLSYQNIRTL